MCVSLLVKGCPCTHHDKIKSKEPDPTKSKERNRIAVPSDEFDIYGRETEAYNSRKWVTDSRSKRQLERISEENNCKGCTCLDAVCNTISLKAADSEEFMRLMRQVPIVDGCCCVRKALDAFVAFSEERHQRRAQRAAEAPQAGPKIKITPAAGPTGGQPIKLDEGNVDGVAESKINDSKQAQSWRHKHLGPSVESIPCAKLAPPIAVPRVPSTGVTRQTSCSPACNPLPAAVRIRDINNNEIGTNTEDIETAMKTNEFKRAEMMRKKSMATNTSVVATNQKPLQTRGINTTSEMSGTNTKPTAIPIAIDWDFFRKFLSLVRNEAADPPPRRVSTCEHVHGSCQRAGQSDKEPSPKPHKDCTDRHCVLCNKPLQARVRTCRICNTPLRTSQTASNGLNHSRERHSILPPMMPINKSKENHCIVGCPKPEIMKRANEATPSSAFVFGPQVNAKVSAPNNYGNEGDISKNYCIPCRPTPEFTPTAEQPKKKTRKTTERSTSVEGDMHKEQNKCIFSALVQHQSSTKTVEKATSYASVISTPAVLNATPTKSKSTRSVASGTVPKHLRKLEQPVRVAPADEKTLVKKWFDEHMPSDSAENFNAGGRPNVRPKAQPQLQAIVEQPSKSAPTDEAVDAEEEEMRLKTLQYKAMPKANTGSDDYVHAGSDMHYTKSWFRKHLPVPEEDDAVLAEKPLSAVSSRSEVYGVKEKENVVKTSDLRVVPVAANVASTEGLQVRSDAYYTKTWFKKHLPSDSSIQGEQTK